MQNSFHYTGYLLQNKEVDCYGYEEQIFFQKMTFVIDVSVKQFWERQSFL